MYYHYEYICKGNGFGELGYLAQMTGYDNVGPILKYPLNKQVLANGFTPGVLKKGEKIFIPWHKPNLVSLIVSSAKLIDKYREACAEIVGENAELTKQIDEKMEEIDQVAELLSLGIHFGHLVHHAHHAMVKHGAGLSETEVIKWLLETGGKFAGGVGLYIAGETLKEDSGGLVTLTVRHAKLLINPLNLGTYIAGAVGAISEGDINIMLFGASAVEHKTEAMVKRSFERDIARLMDVISNAKVQLAMPCYNYRA